MQLTMGFTNGLSHGHAPPGAAYNGAALAKPASKGDWTKQPHAKTQHHHDHHRRGHGHGKSQGFDPEDLRRRLYVVIAQQEATNAQKRIAMLDAEEVKKKMRSKGGKDGLKFPMAAAAAEAQTHSSQKIQGVSQLKDAVVVAAAEVLASEPAAALAPREKTHNSEKSFVARMAKDKDMGTSTTITSLNPSNTTTTLKRSKSTRQLLHDKLRRKHHDSNNTNHITTETEDRPHKARQAHPYVPQEAASQFARTATSDGMRDRALIHSLSQSALRFHTEGRSADDRADLESSITPAAQVHALRRAASHRERLAERNQFSAPGPITIPEDDVAVMGGGVGLRRSLSRSQRQTKGQARKASFGACDGAVVDEASSEEMVVLDLVKTVNQHRVDWTQSDEHAQSKVAKTSARTPLLKKADSIWALKGRFGRHSREEKARRSFDGFSGRLGYVSRHGREDKVVAIVTTNRNEGEKGSLSPRSPKLGFLARLKSL
ncbi:hypothetical protein F5Y15DRAFT_65243 [Xylariaceae sp. FL0016]|nr:hypothetical protein F5Y15DRAFT_65243 [Xylariaceae sp. FL0016]